MCGVRGGERRVDRDAIVDGKAGRSGKLRVRYGADADDHEISPNGRIVGKHNPSIGELGDLRAEVEAHALGNVALVEHLGDLGGHAAGQEPR